MLNQREGAFVCFIVKILYCKGFIIKKTSKKRERSPQIAKTAAAAMWKEQTLPCPKGQRRQQLTKLGTLCNI